MKKKERLTDRISIRVTKEQKKKFIQSAKKKGLPPRDFIMQAVEHTDEYSTSQINEAFLCCKVQELYNCLNVTLNKNHGIELHENTNPKLRKVGEELWNHLSGRM